MLSPEKRSLNTSNAPHRWAISVLANIQTDKKNIVVTETDNTLKLERPVTTNLVRWSN